MKQAGTNRTSKGRARLRFGALIFSFALAHAVPAQSQTEWRIYTAADGLAKTGCASISLSPQGQVLVRHFNTNAISELDGYAINVLPGPVASDGRIAASPGGQLWAIVPEGLQERTDGVWTSFSVPEIAALFRSDTNSAARISLCSVKQGRVLFLLPDRLMEFNIEERDRPRTLLLRSSGGTQLGRFIQMIPACDGGLWITGTRGIAEIPGPLRNVKASTEWSEHLPPDSQNLQNFHSPQPAEDGLTLLCDSQPGGGKAIVHFDGANWETRPVGAAKIRFAWRDSNKNAWAITSDDLLELPAGNGSIATNASLTARKYYDVAVETGGGFWLATSEGLVHRALPVWQTPAPLRPLTAAVHDLAEDSQGRLWFISDDAKVRVMSDDRLAEFPFPAPLRESSPAATTLFPLKNGIFLIGAGETWFKVQLRNTELKWMPVKTSGSPLKALGKLKDGSVCLLKLDSKSSSELSFESYDGTALKPFPLSPLEAPELGEPLVFFSARNGDLWLGCEHGVARWHGQTWQTFTSTDNTVPEPAFHFLELPDEKLWCATRDKVWEFDGRHWSVMNGGLEQIQDLRQTSDGSIWIASKAGLVRNWKHAWIPNDTAEGLPSANIRELFETSDGRIWAATSLGLSLFHSTADQDPPRTIIKSSAGTDRIAEGNPLSFVFDGRDKWNSTPRGRLLYSHRLDQRDWSPFQEVNTASFSELAPGRHYFQARALDRGGNLEAAPAQLEFVVTLPWYKEMRLVLISTFGGGMALFFAWLAFNRHLQLRRSYAEIERKVAERTRQLEIANRELLHSQKMNALGTLAAGIAHDFNNILSIIKGSAQIIEDNLDNQTKVQTRLDRIKLVVEQGSGIVKAMLGFSRDSEGQATPCNANEVVDDTIRLLGDRFLREIEVKFEPAANLPEAFVPKEFIQQILLNFVFNAAEAMTGQKQIVLSTRRISTLPGGVALAPAAAGEYVIIAVRDSGSGIAPEVLPRIFEPFFTTKAFSTRRGTGLGLSMAYELARKMEAGLAVESVRDHGSTFTLILPVTAPTQ